MSDFAKSDLRDILFNPVTGEVVLERPFKQKTLLPFNLATGGELCQVKLEDYNQEHLTLR